VAIAGVSGDNDRRTKEEARPLPDLSLGCRCGTVRGAVRDVSPSGGTHLVCYCRDCQAYARHLGRADLLDPAGGTAIFQTSIGRIAFDAGAERLTCLRLSPKGLVRWYAGCCSTPVINLPPTAALPFGGIVTACLAEADLVAAIGPVVATYKTAQARPGKGAPRRDHGGLTVLRRFAAATLAARRRGEHRTSPFHEGGAPKIAPRVLTAEERRAAYS
jgi:hypothetical protein